MPTNDDDIDKPRSFGEGIEQIYRAVASLEVSITKVAKNQDSFKSELKTVAPRIDAIGSRIDVLAAEIAQLADRVHRTNNIVQVLVDEGAILHQAQQTLSRALDVVETQWKAKAHELEGAHVTLEHMLDVVETRVSRLRNAVVEASEGRSGSHAIPPTDRPTPLDERGKDQ